MSKRYSIKEIFRAINTNLTKRFYFKDLYFFMLKKILKQPEIKICFLPKQRPFSKEIPLIENIKTKTLPKQKLIVRETSLPKNAKTSDNLTGEKPLVTVKSALDFDYSIKWITLNLESLIVNRLYETDLSSKFNAEDFELPDFKKELNINNIDKTELTLPKKAFVIEELLRFIPYKNKLPVDLIYNIPQQKEAAISSEFDSDMMTLFKNSLAQSAKTTLHNVEILSIYEHFYPNLYSMIRRDGRTKKLLCFLDKKKSKTPPGKSYYFIMGKRLDTKKTYTTLVEN